MLGSSWIGHILRRFEDDVTPKQIAAAAGVDRQTAYNWLSGTHSPSSDHLPDLVAHLPRAVGEAILAALATALPSQLQEGLDANGDGRVDARDDVVHGARAIRSAAELEELLGQAIRDHVITADELANLILRANAARDNLTRTVEAARRGKR